MEFFEEESVVSRKQPECPIAGEETPKITEKTYLDPTLPT